METTKVNKILDKWNRDPDYANEILADIHKKWESFPEDVLKYVADELKVPLGRIYNMATFYDWKDVKVPEYPILRTKYEPIVFRNIKEIKPKEIDSYIAVGGYKSLETAVKTMSPSAVIDEIKRSGLISRSGTNSPTGIKLETCGRIAKTTGKTPVIICNGFGTSLSDGLIMKLNPHSVIEGLLIAAYAIGAPEGYLFINTKYTQAIDRINTALKSAAERGLLGERIFDTDFRFNIKIHVAQDAMVCGISKPLISYMTGFAPEPKDQYTRISESGYKGYPSIIENVETLVNIPVIIEKGSGWFANIGKGSAGTKVFLLEGKIAKKGFAEVPFGITLRELISKIGGLKDAGSIKAVQIGGASGGFVPSSMLDESLDFNSIRKMGSPIYDASIRVLDNETCMACELKKLVSSMADGSCGKCVPCRDGLINAHLLIDKIVKGTGTIDDINALESIANTIKTMSFCAYGQYAPSPILSAIKHFRKDFEIHVNEKRCPSGTCECCN